MSSRKSPSHYLEESPTSPGIGEILAPPGESQTQRPIGKKQLRPIGHVRWAIAEGYIPSQSTGPEPEMTSHETACLLNASDHEANVRITIFFSDREPVGPFHLKVPPRRTQHVRFNDLTNPLEIPRDTDYSSLIESDVPIVVQHTRLDSRQSANALISTIAFGEG
ncbi:MAG TPA: sensory rhodopsin transducer [Pirellulales bacterium]|nr:sensory rhodopsin transducer [Pirellulales bacterium]